MKETGQQTFLAAALQAFAGLDPTKMASEELAAYCHTARTALQDALGEMERRAQRWGE